MNSASCINRSSEHLRIQLHEAVANSNGQEIVADVAEMLKHCNWRAWVQERHALEARLHQALDEVILRRFGECQVRPVVPVPPATSAISMRTSPTNSAACGV